MHYKVLNPSWMTWPVKEHAGCITFTELTGSITTATATTTTGCDMEWHVQWTPLAIPLISPLWNRALETITTIVIETSANYVAAASKDAHLPGLL